MVSSDTFAEFLRELLAPLGRVTMRRMFGKTGVFCDGVLLGMVTDNMLYFRVDDDNRAAFKEAESFPPLSYEKKASAYGRPAVSEWHRSLAHNNTLAIGDCTAGRMLYAAFAAGPSMGVPGGFTDPQRLTFTGVKAGTYFPGNGCPDGILTT
ncbi:MAG TPA: TfoX/Sxy family protein [Steroidobacteraceae bacterium]|nr:TfoX/Sxy family protein [Steroidobacteraceae bacterium]